MTASTDFVSLSSPLERYHRTNRYWKIVFRVYVALFIFLVLFGSVGGWVYAVVAKRVALIVWFSLFQSSIVPIIVGWGCIYEFRLKSVVDIITNVKMCYKLKCEWNFDDYMVACEKGTRFFAQCYCSILGCFYFLIMNSILSLSVYFMHIPGIVTVSILLGLSLYGFLAILLCEQPNYWSADARDLDCLYTFEMVGLISNKHVNEIFEIYVQVKDLNEKKKRIELISEPEKKENASVSDVTEEIKREEDSLLKLWADLHEKIIADLPDLQITSENLLI